MGFGLLHLSTYLPILELKIVCPIWYLLSQFWHMARLYQFWLFQRLPNSAHYNSATQFGINKWQIFTCHIWQECHLFYTSV